MSNIGVHSFEIPHEYVRPTRDMVIIRIPFPPKKIGNIITPDITRDLMQHNVMAGRVISMGPLAFVYKDAVGGIAKQPVNVGDWVLIRPFAGTMVQGGKLQVNSGYRYVSSFQDVIGIIPADKMPKSDTLEWDYKNEDAAAAKPTESFGGRPREHIKVPNARS
jgi:co-chaperonin GroES (HSP10)